MTERWVMMVKQSKIDQEPSVEKVNAMVVKLLARQHRAVVLKVKKAYTYGPNFRGGMVPCEEGEWINVKDLLAALAKQGGK